MSYVFNGKEEFLQLSALKKATEWNRSGDEVINNGMKILTIDGEQRSYIKMDEIEYYIGKKNPKVFYTKELYVNGIKGRFRMYVEKSLSSVKVSFSEHYRVSHTSPIRLGSQTKAVR